jgi:hypothetical protein
VLLGDDPAVASPAPAGGGGCSEPRRCQGETPLYWRRGPHAMMVFSAVDVVDASQSLYLLYTVCILEL